VLDPSFTWQTYYPGSNTPQALTPRDLFDCDGSKHINAIVVEEAATWCGPCQDIATATPAKFSGAWNGLGVAYVTILGDGNLSGNENVAPTTADAQWWRDQFGIGMTYVGVDPAESQGQKPPIESTFGGYPSLVIVDPRTMTVVENGSGNDPGYDTAVTTLATKNR
jgi:hypothetical protein